MGSYRTAVKQHLFFKSARQPTDQMVSTKLVLQMAVVAVLLWSVEGQFRRRSTRCYPWRGGLEWRCSKRDHSSDVLTIKNVSGRRVSFKVGEWEAVCGSIGYKYAADEVTLKPREEISYKFKNAYVTRLSRTLFGSFVRFAAGKCNTFYVYDCSVGDCADLLDVYPLKF